MQAQSSNTNSNLRRICRKLSQPGSAGKPERLAPYFDGQKKNFA
jgi:hypothetical protein